MKIRTLMVHAIPQSIQKVAVSSIFFAHVILQCQICTEQEKMFATTYFKFGSLEVHRHLTKTDTSTIPCTA